MLDWSQVITDNAYYCNSCSSLQHPVDFTAFDPSTVDVVPVSLEEVECRDLEGAPVSCVGELAAPLYNVDQDICTGVLLDVSAFVYLFPNCLVEVKT